MARLVVETRRGLNSFSTSRASEMEANSWFGDQSLRLLGKVIRSIKSSSVPQTPISKWRFKRQHPFQFATNLARFPLKSLSEFPKKKWTPTRRVLPRSDVRFLSWWEMQTSEDGQTRKTRLETVLTKYSMNCWIIISPAYVPPLQGEGTKTRNKSA